MQTYDYRVIGFETPLDNSKAKKVSDALSDAGSNGFRVSREIATVDGSQTYPHGYITIIMERPCVSEEEIEEITEQVEGMIHPVSLTPDPSLMGTERRGL